MRIYLSFLIIKSERKKCVLASQNLAQGLAGNGQRSVFPEWRHCHQRWFPPCPPGCLCTPARTNIQRHLAKNCLKMVHPWALLSCEESRLAGTRDVRASDSFQALLNSLELILPQGDPASAKLDLSILNPEAARVGAGGWGRAVMPRRWALPLLYGVCSQGLRRELIRLEAASSFSATWGYTFFSIGTFSCTMRYRCQFWFTQESLLEGFLTSSP